MLLTLVLATAIATGAPIYRCDHRVGEQDVDCKFAIAAWRAGWQPTAPDKSVAIAEKRLRDRADANLLALFPDQAAYWRARQADLEPLMASLKINQARISLLMAEQVPLDNEKEFYPGRQLPVRLIRAEEEIKPILVASNRIAELQRDRIARANAFYDAQLVYLTHLWGGCTGNRIPVVARPVLQPIVGGRMQQVVESGHDVGAVAGKCGSARPPTD